MICSHERKFLTNLLSIKVTIIPRKELHFAGKASRKMAAAQEEDFVDYEEEEEQVAVQTGKDTKKYENILLFPKVAIFSFLLVRATMSGG